MSHPSPDPFLPGKAPAAPESGAVPAAICIGNALAWVGTLIAVLLSSRESALRSFLCPAHGGCETVLQSGFSELRGIPLSTVGMIFYVIQLALWLAVYGISAQGRRLRLLDGILGLALAGVTCSAGLMYVQFGILHAFCPLCTGSALTTGGLLVAAIRARQKLTREAAGASPSGAATLALFAVLPLAVFLTVNRSPGNTASQSLLIELSPGHRTGLPDAPVQLSVFTDFECGFCNQLAPVLQRLAGEFREDLAIVYRHYPIEAHPRAYAAAVAAECAAEQGAFGEYSEKLHADAGHLEDSDFIGLAAALGLDQARFTACLRSAPPRRAVDANVRDATRMGLEGVPAVFLNGRRVKGVLDYEHLARQIRAVQPKGLGKN